MSIGEFEEVGEVIKSFTSENATVVIGTVIDPDMTDELRVTVVVTGLGRDKNLNLAVQTQEVANATPINTLLAAEPIDYSRSSKPTVFRNITDFQIDEAQKLSESMDNNIEYLDIPAFLRRDDKDKDKK